MIEVQRRQAEVPGGAAQYRVWMKGHKHLSATFLKQKMCHSGIICLLSLIISLLQHHLSLLLAGVGCSGVENQWFNRASFCLILEARSRIYKQTPNFAVSPVVSSLNNYMMTRHRTPAVLIADRANGMMS
jgi:hypothetical protein